MSPRFAALAFSLLSVPALLLTGCSANFDSSGAPPSQLSVGNISGRTWGGRQPIAGARVYLLQTNTGNYAGPGLTASASNASVSLLRNIPGTTQLDSTSGSYTNGDYYVTTDANGAFTITGDYNTCASGSQVYLYSAGGKPDGTNANSGAGLMAVLGACGSYNSSTTVNMNEVSTIAAAYAMAGFATDPGHVGAPSASNTLAATGIANAFANANQMFDISSNPYNNPNTVARTSTPNSGTRGGAGTVPQQQINTLANILAACVNTTAPTSAQCSDVFTLHSTGTTGNAPTDTAAAAIYMAQNAGSSAISTVYNATGVSGAPNPYNPWYHSLPNDFSIQLTFSGAGLTAGYTNYEGVVVDNSGSIWVASGQGSTTNTSGTVLSGFDHLGVPVATGGFGSLGLQLPAGMAIDSTGTYLYISSYDNNSVVKFNLTNDTVAATLATGSGTGPYYVAVDSAGYPWAVLSDDNNDAGKVVKLDPSSGTVLTTLSGNGISGPNGVAFQSGSLGNAWVTNAGGVGISVFTNSGTVVGNDTSNVTFQMGMLAFDANNNGYSSLVNGNGVLEVPASNIQTDNWYKGDFGDSENELAIDGANRVWFANNDFTSAPTNTPQKNAIFLLSSTGTIANGANGYQATPSTVEPDSLAIDASGNIWFNSQSDGNLHEIVGAAVPVSLPVAYATANSKLGARP